MNVLAFESDPAQADAIRHVVCNLVGARLTVATSIEQALHTLRESTPDLVLLPALVSPSQEAALLETLRSLPNASHVETQISPVLPPRRRVIAAPQGWRRWTSRRPADIPVSSTESKAFAERLKWALERARERKAHAVPIDDRRLTPHHEHAEPAPDVNLDRASNLIEPVTMTIDDAPPRSLVQLLDGLNDAPAVDATDLELADATSRLLRKLGQPSASDRRQYRRFAARELPGLRAARIKFGPKVAIVDVSAGGALLETDARLQPDSEDLLELVGSAGETVVPFRVIRCQIAGPGGPARYLGACAFKEPLVIDDLAWGAARLSANAAMVKSPALTLVSSRATVRNAW